MRFRLPARLGDWVTTPEHLVEAPSPLALMPQNRFHLVLLFSLNQYGRRWLLLSFELCRPVESFQIRHMKNRMKPQAGGRFNLYAIREITREIRNGPIQRRRNLLGKC